MALFYTQPMVQERDKESGFRNENTYKHNDSRCFLPLSAIFFRSAFDWVEDRVLAILQRTTI